MPRYCGRVMRATSQVSLKGTRELLKVKSRRNNETESEPGPLSSSHSLSITPGLIPMAEPGGPSDAWPSISNCLGTEDFPWAGPEHRWSGKKRREDEKCGKEDRIVSGEVTDKSLCQLSQNMPRCGAHTSLDTKQTTLTRVSKFAFLTACFWDP